MKPSACSAYEAPARTSNRPEPCARIPVRESEPRSRIAVPPALQPSFLPSIAAGDEAAFQGCLDTYGGLVWSIARRLCGDRGEAEDAVQEVFVEIWKSAGRYDAAKASEQAFIAMIARRRVIDRRRRAQRREPATDLTEAIECSAQPVEERAELRDEAAQAAAALSELRPEQRQVLELSIYRGLTHAQISAATGMPLGTVKTHARRGLIRVRELLEA
jgi:RNA polymerase sigma factor (sigma-70 family)